MEGWIDDGWMKERSKGGIQREGMIILYPSVSLVLQKVVEHINCCYILGTEIPTILEAQ